MMSAILQTRVSVCVGAALALIGVVNLFGYYGEYNFPHIPLARVPYQLSLEVNPHLVQSGLPPCDYKEVLHRTATLSNWQIPSSFDTFSAHGLTNGSWAPADCAARLSVALLVTYRNRQQHLNVFLPYMHNFLRAQNIHYKIFLIEQQDDKPWNKGLLYNTGARVARQEGWPCLILHDVDLLPLDAGNLYACLQSPRHLSGAVDTLRLTLPYRYLIGGVLAISSAQYWAAGGMSEQYTGWGGEDDDFYYRLSKQGYEVVRLPPQLSRYTMLPHRRAPLGPRGHALLEPRPHREPARERSAYTLRPHPMFVLVGVHT